jgi:hypothetical protein
MESGEVPHLRNGHLEVVEGNGEQEVAVVLALARDALALFKESSHHQRGYRFPVFDWVSGEETGSH